MTYIPRSSLSMNTGTGAIPRTIQKKHTFHIFGFIATSLLVLSLLAVAGTFLYKGYLDKQLVAAKEDLHKKESVDYEKTINELEAFNRRLIAAGFLLENHLAPSRLFAKLEAVTKETVQYDSVTYEYTPGDKATLDLTAGTKEFTSVAIQKLQFNKDGIFEEFQLPDITSSVDADDGANGGTGEKKLPVGFGVKGILNIENLKYTGAPYVPAQSPVVNTPVSSTTGSSTAMEDSHVSFLNF